MADMRPSRAMVLLLLGTLLPGCVAVPRPDVAVTLPSAWRNGTTTAVPANPIPAEWWRRFGDPGLDAIVQQALAENLDARAAVYRLHAARTLRGNADAPFLPQMHAGTFDAIDPDANASYFVVGFDAGWESGWFGRRSATRDLAQGEVDSRAADWRDARASLIAEVVRNWIDLRTAQARTHELTRIVQARQAQAVLVATRVRLQLAAGSEQLQAEAAVASAQAALAAPTQQAIASQQRLAALLGKAEPDASWQEASTPPTLAPLNFATVPRDVLRARPDIARHQAELLQSLGNAGLAVADQYPSIGLGGSLHWATNITSHGPSQSDKGIGALGPVIDIPLFDWGMRRAHAMAQGDEVRAAALAYRQSVLDAVAEAETALASFAQEHQQLQTARHLQDLRTQFSERIATRRRLGLASDIDTADADIESAQVNLSLLDAEQGEDLAWVAVCKALGIGASPADAVVPTTAESE